MKLMRHVKAHAALYTSFLLGGKISPMHPRIVALFSDMGVGRVGQVVGVAPNRRELIDRQAIAYAAIGSTMGVIAWWLRTGLKRSPEYVAERLGWLLTSGAYPLLGLAPLVADE